MIWVTRSRWLALVRSPVLGGPSCEYRKRPARTSHIVLSDSRWVRCPKVTAGTVAWVRVVVSNGLARVGLVGLTQASLCRLWTRVKRSVSFQVSFPNTLSCSYVLGNRGSLPGWLS